MFEDEARTIWDAYAADAGETSGRVSVQGFENVNLYLNVDGATDITTEMSPNSGEDWMEAGTTSFSGSGTDVVEIALQGTSLRITTSDAVTITAIVYLLR